MRLIDADAIPYCNYDLDRYHSFRAVDEDEIAEMPTLTLDDLRPKGRWIKTGSDHYVECSECKSPMYIHSIAYSFGNFCPNCGADMRGGVGQ